MEISSEGRRRPVIFDRVTDQAITVEKSVELIGATAEAAAVVIQ